MIITCNNCDKKFEIDSQIIPENGRLLQCSGCRHKWFFKKNTTNKLVTPIKTINPMEKAEPKKNENPETIELLDKIINNEFLKEKTSINDKIKQVDNIKTDHFENKNSYNILKLITLFIISFVALIIVLDTFKSPLNKIIPNIEQLLYNLYESIKDILLFFSDLI